MANCDFFDLSVVGFLERMYLFLSGMESQNFFLKMHRYNSNAAIKLSRHICDKKARCKRQRMRCF